MLLVLGILIGIILLPHNIIAAVTVGLALGWATEFACQFCFAKNFKNSFSKRQDKVALDPKSGSALFLKFNLLGKLAKVDGRISPCEIATVEEVMTDIFGDDSKRRQKAIHSFRRGARKPYQYSHLAWQYFLLFSGQRRRLLNLVELMYRVAAADGQLALAEEEMIQVMRKQYGISLHQIRKIKRKTFGDPLYGEYQWWEQERESFRANEPGSRDQNSQYDQSASWDLKQSSNDSYAILGLERGASLFLVKRAYRKLVKKYHPDKLTALNLSPEFYELGRKKFLRVHEAYQTILRREEKQGGNNELV